MVTKNLNLVPFETAYELMNKLQQNHQKNILLFAKHHPIFTVGKSEAKNFPFAYIVDRGGSITYFDEGTLMCYFIFKVKSPPLFFRKVVKIFSEFFKELSENIYYDIKRPGFYIQSRKIASIGFNYKNGVSKHGVSIHLNPNLENFNKINPCNLKGVTATSLKQEGIEIKESDIINKITALTLKHFGEKNETES
jgi:lipoyl(octanoyl) transferase